MSLEAIIEKIRGDAEKESKAILTAARQEKKQARSTRAVELKERYNKERAKMKANRRDMRARKEFHLRSESARELMNFRRLLIERAITKAVRNIASDKNADYLDLISVLLGRCTLCGDVEVIISPDDESRITEAFIKKHSLKSGRFVLSQERRDFIGGVILRAGDISQNGAFSKIVELAREELVMALSGLVPLETARK